MLDFFRQPQSTRLSAYLIAISLLIKMLMPVAHASTAVSVETKGFFTALCTANGVVPFNQEGNNSHPNTQQVNSTSICPLCSLMEQSLFDSTALQSADTQAYSIITTFSPTDTQQLLSTFIQKQRPIRAPPLYS